MIGVDALIVSGFVFNIMEKSIPLKEIVGFLPYGLKVMHTDFESEGSFTQEAEIESINLECISFKSNWSASDYYFIDPDNEIKPIVRPLSDLTKEITHNGETFVPEEFLNNNSKDFYLPDDWNAVLFIENENIMSVNYTIIQKLYEWHFDIYDWIKDGKAIDINTL